MTVGLFVRKCFGKLFLSPTGTSSSIRDPCKRFVIFAAQQSTGVKVDLGVTLFVKSDIGWNIYLWMSESGLRRFGPLDQTSARKAVVRLYDECFYITIARRFCFALLHQRRCRITIGSLSVGINRNCFLIPDLSLREILFLQVDVAGEKRCMVKLR